MGDGSLKENQGAINRIMEDWGWTGTDAWFLMEPLLGLNTLMCVKCLTVVGTRELRPLSWETEFMAHQTQANCFLVHMGKLRSSREGNGPTDPADQL